LTVAAMVPASLFLLMVLAGSMHGLVAFGRSVLGWRDGWEYLVPGTLDGVSVAFAFLAFRAVRRGKAPDRCYRVVWGAAGASAAINFSYEFGESANALAGGYVGLLSLLGMMMFHELLAQFEDGADRIRRDNPKFGLRWLTWPSNTFLAAVAWRNHPPADGTPGTVTNAVANLERVRQLKQERRTGVPGTPPRRTAEPVPRLPGGLAEAVHAPRTTPAGFGASRERRAGFPATAQPRVPTTEATVQLWVQTWVRMCSDSDLWSRPLTDDIAQARYNLSARQLRRLRRAAETGALRRRAESLGVPLPTGYIDHPPNSANTTRSN
jgi:hypothetical protein